MSFVANFIRFPAVQKFWKSVKIWQSYREFKGGNFFLRHSVHCFLMFVIFKVCLFCTMMMWIITRTAMNCYHHMTTLCCLCATERKRRCSGSCCVDGQLVWVTALLQLWCWHCGAERWSSECVGWVCTACISIARWYPSEQTSSNNAGICQPQSWRRQCSR